MLNNSKDLKSQSLFGKIVKGIVVINEDPLRLGRIKVRISELHPSTLSNEDLPWVMSFNFIGGVNSQGSINIPDINSEVWILFPSDDLYSGCYLGSLPNISEELKTNYPFSYGFIDRSGNLLLINTEQDTFSFYHVSGTNLNIDGSGHTKIQIANYQNSNTNSTSNNPLGLDIEVIGDLNLKVSNKISIESKELEVKVSDNVNYNIGNLTCNCVGMVNYNTNSSYNLSSGSTINLNATDVITAIGSSGVFGGNSSTLDGHLVGFFQTDISHTPFMAFQPQGIPPIPSITNVTRPQITEFQEPQPRQRQAYKGNDNGTT